MGKTLVSDGNVTIPGPSGTEDELISALVNAINTSLNADPWDMYPTEPGMTTEQLAALSSAVSSGSALPEDLAAILDPDDISSYNAWADFMKGESDNYVDNPFDKGFQEEMAASIDDWNNPWVQNQLGGQKLINTISDALNEILPGQTENINLSNELLASVIANLNSPEAQARRSAETNYWNEVASEAAIGIDLGSITGDLTPEQEEKLNTQLNNAVTMLNTSVQRNVMDSLGSSISRLVGKGVLNSSVAENAFMLIGQRIGEITTSGMLGLHNEFINAELGLSGQNWVNRLNAEMGRANFISGGGLAAGPQGSADEFNALGAATASNPFANWMDYLGGSNQYYAGLGQQSNMAGLNYGSGLYNSVSGNRLALSSALMGVGMNNTSAQAAQTAGLYSGLGSFTGMLGSAFLMS